MAIALPLLATDFDAPPPFRDLCTDCGLSRTSEPSRCGTACQFIAPDYPRLETQVHGRPRDLTIPDELHFGPHTAMWRARMRTPVDGAQWTGITTRLAARLLETGEVDAVLATAADPDDRWRPRPVLVRQASDMAQCRGMRMGYSPVLALLDEAAALGLRRLAIVGVPCQIHALRAIEAELGLERLIVIGTPCSDNTHTERFHHFLSLLTPRPGDVTYLEFLADYRVELRFADGAVQHVAYAQLPIDKLPRDFIPLTCRSCFDYTNALADVVVGYLAGDGDQWVIARNERGLAALALLGDELERELLTTRGARAKAVGIVAGALARQAGGLPLRRAPVWARPMIGWMQRRFGPRGLEFARARIEMKAIEGVLNLRAERPRRMRRLVPAHAWALAAPYAVTPLDGERTMETTTRHGTAPTAPAVR